MKSISYWARNHGSIARLMIIVSHLCLMTFGIWAGIQTYFQDFRIPYVALLIILNLFFASYFLYPIKGNTIGIWKHSYARQKSHDFILLLTGTLSLIIATNHFAFEPMSRPVVEPEVRLMIFTPSTSIDSKASEHHITKEVKLKFIELRQRIKTELKQMKPDQHVGDGKKTGTKILLIALAILGAGFLLLFVAAASCQLGCSGNGFGAVALALLGTAGIIWLFVILLKKILKIGRQPEVETIRPVHS